MFGVDPTCTQSGFVCLHDKIQHELGFECLASAHFSMLS